MKVSIVKYEHLKPAILNYTNNHKDLSLNSLISSLVIMFPIPIIVICYFISESIGMTDELKERIKIHKEFYKYTEIEGKELYENNTFIT